MTKQKDVIYVIDHDALVRGVFSRLFQSAGFTVKTFSSPQKFLAEPRQEEGRCIVADFWAPSSSASIPVKELANLHIPIIAVSATEDPEAREEARTMGAVMFFLKPVDHEALLDAVRWVQEDRNRTGSGPSCQEDS